MRALTGIEIRIFQQHDGKLIFQTVTGAGDNKTVSGRVVLPAKIDEAMQVVLSEAQHRIFQIFLDDVAVNYVKEKS